MTAERGVDLAWLYDDGRFAARLTTLDGAGDPELRLAQYHAAVDERDRLRIAHQIVAGKITNMRVGLLRAARSQQDPELAEHQPRLAAARTSALAASNVAELMGCSTRPSPRACSPASTRTWACCIPRTATVPPSHST